MDPRDRRNLIDDLSSSDDEIRRLAVERLSELPEADSLPLLVERLGDASWRVRKAAVERLADCSDPDRLVATLIEALADGENPGRRNAALESLTRCGASVVPALVEASGDSDVDVRKQIVDALAGIAHPAATDRLMALLADPDPNVRGAAADALGETGATRAADALLACARDDAEPLVQLSALRGLAQLEVTLPTAVLDFAFENPLLRAAGFALLGYGEDEAGERYLFKGLTEGGRSLRRAAIEAVVRRATRSDDGAFEGRVCELLRAEPSALGSALECLPDAPLPERLVLVQFLGISREPACVGPLLLAGLDEALTELVLVTLETFGPGIDAQLDAVFPRLPHGARLLAAQMLARTSGAVGERRLRRCLADPSSELRAAAAKALGERGAESSLGELVIELERTTEHHEDGEVEVADAIAGAIVQIVRQGGRAVGARAVDRLCEPLAHSAEGFRVEAARVFGEIGSADDVARIGFLLSDPSPRVRRAAAEALGRLADGRSPEVLRLALADESEQVRIGAASALAATGDPSVLRDLATLASDADERVRAAAMRAVGDLAREVGADAQEAARLLGRGVAEGGRVALAALAALEGWGGPAAKLAQPVLDSEEPEIVAAAMRCIARHGDTAALEALLPCISHADWSVRVEAAQALAERGFEHAVPGLLRRLEVERDDFVRDALLQALSRLER